MRGVISLVFALSPVESYPSFPKLGELTKTVYARAMSNSREILNEAFEQNCAVEKLFYKKRFTELVAADK